MQRSFYRTTEISFLDLTISFLTTITCKHQTTHEKETLTTSGTNQLDTTGGPNLGSGLCGHVHDA
jgi:hypothetical protein